jgi:hypothetical protein
VLGAIRADVVDPKPVMVKQGATTDVSTAPPADNSKNAIFATNLSILSTEFDAMHAAIMMPLADPRFFPCKSMSSTGLTPWSSIMGSA